MPQILIDYSADLEFDSAGFVKEVHPLITEVIDTSVADCKTAFRARPRSTRSATEPPGVRWGWWRSRSWWVAVSSNRPS